MTAPLGDDLRVRLVAAVEAGASGRSAAKRFGVAPSTTIKWMALWRQEGHVKPRPMGGDRRSHQTEAHALFWGTGGFYVLAAWACFGRGLSSLAGPGAVVDRRQNHRTVVWPELNGARWKALASQGCIATRGEQTAMLASLAETRRFMAEPWFGVLWYSVAVPENAK